MGDLIHTFGVDWKLIIAQAINFAVVVVVLGYFVFGPVMRLLKERADKIAEGLSAAEAARKDRETLAGERQSVLQEAHHNAETIVARAQEDGKNERATIVKQAQDRAEALLKDAQLEAEEQKRAALKASEAEIARTAVLAAEKILRSNV
jgi:F-type H+-transporting ATPase subunit b